MHGTIIFINVKNNLFFKFKGCGNDAAATFKIYFGRATAQWIVLYPRISFLPCYFTQKNPGTVLVFWKKKKNLQSSILSSFSTPSCKNHKKKILSCLAIDIINPSNPIRLADFMPSPLHIWSTWPFMHSMRLISHLSLHVSYRWIKLG